MHPTGRPAYSDDIEIAALLRAIGRRKWRIALFALVAAIATYAALSFVTPLYTSEARILIEREENVYKRPADSRIESEQGGRLDQETVASQVQVLLSRDLALGVVKELNLEENPEFNADAGGNILWRRVMRVLGLDPEPTKAAVEERVLDAFSRRLDVYRVQDSHVIAVSFQSRDPETAARAANTLASLYLTWQQSEKLNQTKEASAWLRNQIEDLRKKVEEADMQAEHFRSSSGLLEGSENTTLDAQQLSELNSQLILAKAQRTEAEARAALIQKMLEEKGDVAAAADVLNSRLIQRLLEQRVRVQRQLAELSATLMPSHPRIRELNSELSDLQSRIREEAHKVVSSLENEAQIAGAREESLRDSLAEIKQTAARGNESQIKLRAYEREAKANRELLESYLGRYSDALARSDQNSVPAHASIISRAHAPSEPSFPKKGPISLLVFAAVGILGMAYSVARELIMPEESYAATEYGDAPAAKPREPVLADAPPAQQSRMPAVMSPRGIARHLKSLSAKRVIVAPMSKNVEAAGQAIETARELAGAGSATILVDILAEGDHVAIALDLPEGPGARQLLSEDSGFETTVRRDPDSALHVISGTTSPGQMCEIDSKKAVSALGALEAIYDRIVIYAAPGQARALFALPAHMQPALVVVAGADGSRDDALWVADQILADTSGTANVSILTDKEKWSWKRPQMPFWRRAAAV